MYLFFGSGECSDFSIRGIYKIKTNITSELKPSKSQRYSILKCINILCILRNVETSTRNANELPINI